MNQQNNSSAVQADQALTMSWQAFHEYSQLNLNKRADFMRAIAHEIGLNREALIGMAHNETFLKKERLEN